MWLLRQITIYEESVIWWELLFVGSPFPWRLLFHDVWCNPFTGSMFWYPLIHHMNIKAGFFLSEKEEAIVGLIIGARVSFYYELDTLSLFILVVLWMVPPNVWLLVQVIVLLLMRHIAWSSRWGSDMAPTQRHNCSVYGLFSVPPKWWGSHSPTSMVIH